MPREPAERRVARRGVELALLHRLGERAAGSCRGPSRPASSLTSRTTVVVAGARRTPRRCPSPSGRSRALPPSVSSSHPPVTKNCRFCDSQLPRSPARPPAAGAAAAASAPGTGNGSRSAHSTTLTPGPASSSSSPSGPASSRVEPVEVDVDETTAAAPRCSRIRVKVGDWTSRGIDPQPAAIPCASTVLPLPRSPERRRTPSGASSRGQLDAQRRGSPPRWRCAIRPERLTLPAPPDVAKARRQDVERGRRRRSAALARLPPRRSPARPCR